MRILLRSLFIAIALVAAGGVLWLGLAGLAYTVRLASLPAQLADTWGGAINPLLHPGAQKG